MLPTPRSLVISLALLCGVATAHSQLPSPSDRVFLTERVPVSTHSGLTGFPPGMALHVISTNGDTFRVSDGTLTFDVPKAKLTTDANLAARLAQNNYAAAEAAAQVSAQQMEAYRQAQAAKRAEQERNAAAMRQAQQQAEAQLQRQEQAAARQQQAELQRAQAAKVAAEAAAKKAARRTVIIRGPSRNPSSEAAREELAQKLRATEGHIINAKALGLPHEEIEQMKEESRRLIQDAQAAGILNSGHH